jgi:hypothetical protein
MPNVATTPFADSVLRIWDVKPGSDPASNVKATTRWLVAPRLITRAGADAAVAGGCVGGGCVGGSCVGGACVDGGAVGSADAVEVRVTDVAVLDGSVDDVEVLAGDGPSPPHDAAISASAANSATIQMHLMDRTAEGGSRRDRVGRLSDRMTPSRGAPNAAITRNEAPQLSRVDRALALSSAGHRSTKQFDRTWSLQSGRAAQR